LLKNALRVSASCSRQGRIAFGLEPNERSFARLPQVTLQNGDRLVVPSKPAFVHVFGAVNVEASPLWKPNSRVKDYLKLAGTTSDADIDKFSCCVSMAPWCRRIRRAGSSARSAVWR
jgi:hypothetical protein